MARTDPAAEVDSYLIDAIRRIAPVGVTDSAGDGKRLLALFDAQAGSRQVDLAARDLGRRGLGYYSIGSAGHESNAAVAAALRPTDPALLHYRSGAFYVERASQVPGQHPLRDMLHGIVASVDDPISGGRHKVFGNADLSVIPQTSTIASHLPRSVGLAFALGRAYQLGVRPEWPADSVVVCSFGDASANHSTAVGAINAALHANYQGAPMPLLLVCEDNEIGISVPTPRDWIERTYAERDGLAYFAADGADPVGCLEAATKAAEWVRERRSPAFLHLRTIRLMGHAGSDVESAYRAPAEITGDYGRDPLLGTARALVATGTSTPAEVIDLYESKRSEVAELTAAVLRSRRLTSTAEVMATIATTSTEAIARRVSEISTEVDGTPLTVAQSINRALADELAYDDRVVVFGEDVGRKGGVYGVTRGLRKAFGARRVFDTLLDEQSVLGTALGSGLAGLLPVPEIQYLAYLHNASDQLRGEASTLSFFSNGRYRNPMVIRIAGYAYQKGFGGHFHNDNGIAALRDIPGLVIASPSRPDDAASMMHTCLAAAAVDGRVCVFLEPIALYHTKDLYADDDGRWLAAYPDPGDPSTQVPLGRARTYGDGTDLTIVTFGNGVRMSMRAARRLSERGVSARVVDLRWLAPLPVEDLMEAAAATGRVLVADETRRTGGVSEQVTTALVDSGFAGRVARVASEDSFVPLGDATRHVLLDEDTIVRAATDLIAR
ncbi:thiamine pyrophosphate-dependent enzyme [Solicola gregarius]|uniref:Thiamine pyrophosphate-dependent enzyme n=1 Tax=Solicola gregarius TaxID=2908642 RepID=A0AA46TF54_9ACTN|nr:thiamine pyrophosphate-dependent enzyme [Solicola gregarius]UYM03428.1 thiamine pyrophosphate-dependent enzyme [Solicola gregarius]